MLAQDGFRGGHDQLARLEWDQLSTEVGEPVEEF